MLHSLLAAHVVATQRSAIRMHSSAEAIPGERCHNTIVHPTGLATIESEISALRNFFATLGIGSTP